VTPAFVTIGLPGNPVDGITVENMRIQLRVRRDDSLAVPDRSSAYPTVTMFGSAPASGLYLRHARDVRFWGVELEAAH